MQLNFTSLCQTKFFFWYLVWILHLFVLTFSSFLARASDATGGARYKRIESISRIKKTQGGKEKEKRFEIASISIRLESFFLLLLFYHPSSSPVCLENFGL
ncbi:hypothetical protein MCOR25_007195 [Pyricularia grisea]|nr:hypothetical protein MCOR25_007195 [Pyricularia grisea]